MKNYRVRTGKKTDEQMDEFLGLSEKVKIYVQDNQTKAYTALGVVGLVIILTVLVSLFMMDSARNQLAKFNDGLKYYDITSPAPGDKPMEPAERYKKAVEVLSDLASGPYAGLSGYYRSNALMESGDMASAIDGYKALVAASSTDPVVYSLASLRLAVALSANGDMKGAMDVYQTLTEKGLVKDEAHFMLGRMNELLGEKDKALAEYRLVKKDFPDSPWVAEANAKIIEMDPAAAAAAAAAMPAPAEASIVLGDAPAATAKSAPAPAASAPAAAPAAPAAPAQEKK